MKKIFNRIQKMVDNNQDISMSTHMLDIREVNLGAILRVGVTKDCIHKLANNDKYMFALLVINKEQLNSIKLESEANNE